jgi:predicted small lipoprotein YifL
LSNNHRGQAYLAGQEIVLRSGQTRTGIGKAAILIGLLALSAVLAGCGRRGDPLPPSSAAVLATDEQGQVVKQQQAPAAVPDRRFILDGLLD